MSIDIAVVVVLLWKWNFTFSFRNLVALIRAVCLCNRIIAIKIIGENSVWGIYFFLGAAAFFGAAFLAGAAFFGFGVFGFLAAAFGFVDFSFGAWHLLFPNLYHLYRVQSFFSILFLFELFNTTTKSKLNVLQAVRTSFIINVVFSPPLAFSVFLAIICKFDKIFDFFQFFICCRLN